MLYETVDRAYSTMMEDIRPLRDMRDGFSSAVSLFWTGYYRGFEGLVFDYPIEGFMTNGIVGLMKGTVAGAFHFGVMTASGIVAGLYQAVRGMERTFEAIRASKEGKIWNRMTK
jgi:hypothetical protein